jgi:hypothetical protein
MSASELLQVRDWKPETGNRKQETVNRPRSFLTSQPMNKDDVQLRWFELERKMVERFGKKPDVETILFLIGMQELGEVGKKFSKEQKQDLMHIAVCTVMVPSGYYELSFVDPDGWPHYKQLKPMPELNPFEQEIFLKDHILLYFQQQEFNQSYEPS